MQLRKNALWKSVSCCSVLLCSFAVSPALRAQSAQQQCTSTAPDNTARNKAHARTADQQKENASDRTITRNIRRAIVGDKSLSMYGHNVKIITQNGVVTLKGPVHSEEEKKSIEEKAAEVAGQDKVTNQLTVKR